MRKAVTTLNRIGANSMNMTSTEQAKGGVQVVQPMLQTNTQLSSTNNLAGNFVREVQPGPRHVGYGLPCSKCGTYYIADLSVCPICKCGERISPTTIPARAGLKAQLTQMNWRNSASPSGRNSSRSYSPPPCRSIRQHVSAAAWKRTMRAATNQQRSADPVMTICRREPI